MDSSMVQYECKLKKLLTKFLEPGYRLGNDVYLNILLSHLAGKENEAKAEELKRLPIFTEWLSEAVTQWETTMMPPSPSIATFTLNLASLISVNESNFITLNTNNFYIRLVKVLNLRSPDITPSVKLGYLKMLHSFASHGTGLDFLIATEYWNDILTYCLENQTIYITRDGYNFMFDLLSKCVDINMTFCELVVKKIISCLEADNLSLVVGTEIDDVLVQKNLAPTLKLVTFILEKCFDNRKVSEIFISNYNIETTLWNILMIARDPEFVFHVSKPLYILSFFMIDNTKAPSNAIALPIIKEFAKKFFNIFNTLINKKCTLTILKLCHLGHTYWKKLSVPRPNPECKEQRLFENQLIIFQIMPILFIAFNSTTSDDLRKDELTDTFVHKLFKISCEQTIRCAYSYRSLLQSNSLNCFDISQKAIFYLMKTKQNFDRDRAVIVFQALMYAMKNLTKEIVDKTQLAIDLIAHHTGFLSALLDGLSMLIKDFKITWRESVETICLTSLTIDFLSCPNLPNKLTVQGLQLLHLTIANFMPPNLALLVEDVGEASSSISTITPILYKRLHDTNWEVRDSALEIFQTIVDIGYLKFPSFQKMIINDRLCQLAVMLTTDDPESFVRASAIKTVTAMVKVPKFWTKCLEYEDLPEKMMSVLKHETEAIVRCEAANLICEIYEHQYIPSDMLMSVYTAMASAATFDLHWEVKVNALNFWDKVISNEMSNQGMIDGVFPSVTFSKENKKIVTLTEREIQNRLNKVLINLSENGCLGILLETIQDDCDLQVARKSLEVTKKLAELLKKYNMLSSIPLPSVELNRGCWDTFYNKKSSDSSDSGVNMSDSVIDSIINCSDMNLLANVFQDTVKTNHVNGDLRNLKIVKPEVFKSFVSKDLDTMIDDRSKWLADVDDLGSLLDDILQSYEDNDVNSMDCY